MLVPDDSKAPPPSFEAIGTKESSDYPPEKVSFETARTSEDEPDAGWTSGPAVSYLIYQSPGWFKLNLDVVVKGEDKEEVEYYLEDPRKMTSLMQTNMTLHRSSIDGPVVATVTNPKRCGRVYEVNMADTNQTIPYQCFLKSATSEVFQDKNGVNLQWKNATRFLTGDWVCRNADTGDVVARWRRTMLAKLKEGQLMIIPTFADQAELLLTTGLAIEGWARRERGN